MSESYSVQAVTAGLKRALSEYLQAQYHVRDEGIVSERSAMFDEPGFIAQLPFVEATPTYAVGKSIEDLAIPDSAKRLLTFFVANKLGVPAAPYVHQSSALEAFLDKGEDILAATGTGSGKTEIFLLNILGQLAIEAQDRRSTSCHLPGCRALLLYPMNALVTDQLGRIRRLFGNDIAADELERLFGRRVRFGMYTSRTAFPGAVTASKCNRFLKALFEDHYLRLEGRPEQEKLRSVGRWPCKDLRAFYGVSGTRWDRRLQTQPRDTELFTRHEMQRQCPDLLITNYSMLEYMMLRPIERTIFEQTQTWLAADARNQLTLVLDEAHLYRGTGGAEVAMLIRRLMARLGVGRDRLRCILTSASMGSGKLPDGTDAGDRATQFANELTGVPENTPKRFRLIRGVPEQRPSSSPATAEQARALASFDLAAFQALSIDPIAAEKAVSTTLAQLGLPKLSGDPKKLADDLFETLPGLPVVNLLIGTASKATEFTALASQLFPGVDSVLAASATQALLALANGARSAAREKVLLPARLHLFFRGLQGLYVCINAKCTARTGQQASRFGKLWPRPQQYCTCGARVFELMTHRDCGTEYLRAYVPALRAGLAYLFHEKESDIGYTEIGTHQQLREIHLLVGRPPHARAAGESSPIWIHTMTGQGEAIPTRPVSEYLEAHFSTDPSTDLFEPHSFTRCPACLKGWMGRTKIMDLKTKGEQPFAALTKSQLFLQPPTKNDPTNFPNGGRKVLLFSDGRQKAARLARDIPREIGNDSFRECLALAVRRLEALRPDAPVVPSILYIAFLDVVGDFHLSFFEAREHHDLLRDARAVKACGTLGNALEDLLGMEPPARFKEGLLRQVCAPYYSLPFITAGWLGPKERKFAEFHRSLESGGVTLTSEDARGLVISWIAELASGFAISGYSNPERVAAAGFPRGSWGVANNRLPAGIQALLELEGFSSAQLALIRARLFEVFAQREENDVWFLNQSHLTLKIDLDAPWFQCDSCLNLNPVSIRGRCPDCGESVGAPVNPDTNKYLRSRKGLWRQAMRECLAGRAPKTVNAEEHTAQLSYRDAGTVLATTEQHELLFQDLIINHSEESPVDILSATTTMEVGIDIGGLTAVGLRNVPPQRENYQQRAGRAGRRGSAVSSVVTYCHSGPHDNHYFQNVAKIVSGEPRPPMIKANNPKIVGRHVHSFLIQTYFQRFTGGSNSGALNSALGATASFFTPADQQPSMEGFRRWVEEELLVRGSPLVSSVLAWIPPGVDPKPQRWLDDIARSFLVDLEASGAEAMRKLAARPENEEDAEGDEREETKFLDFLFSGGFLPTYAFPTDLAAFNIEELDPTTRQVSIKERPQQSVAKALTEYAPGRLVVVDKKTYRCCAVTASTSSFEPNRAAPLFTTTLKRYVFCKTRGCSYVTEAGDQEQFGRCPLCNAELRVGEILRPEVFLPHRGIPIDEFDSDQEMTFASPAQFPIPLHELDAEKYKSAWRPLGTQASKLFAPDRKMIILNKGDPDRLEGFTVCRQCGFSKLHVPGETLRRHPKPYDISRRRNAPPPDTHCSDEGRRVYLGNEFVSDLMVLRINGARPLELDPNPGLAAFAAMQHAMRTVAEALTLAASVRLQLDPAEFSSGFRVFPSSDPNTIWGEIYLFDTLSGGAGYSNAIGEELDDVLRSEVLPLLENCTCSRSCYDCLRHYGNQFYHGELDRHLGRTLLEYALTGNLPRLDLWEAQMAALKPLAQMLELAGCDTKLGTKVDGKNVPLLVTGGSGTIALGTCHGLYSNASHSDHPLTKVGLPVPSRIINEFLLSRNLPAVTRVLLPLVE